MRWPPLSVTCGILLSSMLANAQLHAAIMPTTLVDPVCGDGVVEFGEECDDGGTCIGGSNAGRHCTAENQCVGNGVCSGGPRAEAECADDSGCPLGQCVHCVPFGGDGCAANCTLETAVPVSLVPGHLTDNTADPGASEATIWDPLLSPLAIPLRGTATVLIGRARGGQLPLVLRRSPTQPPADAQGIACLCVRGVAAKTCGGTIFDGDGVTPSLDCTPGYTAGDSVCTDAGQSPCAFVYGPGNDGAGIIGCAGVVGINISITQDSRGSADPDVCDPTSPHYNPPTPSFPLCGDPPVTRWFGVGPPGSAVIWMSEAAGQAIGSCAAQPSSFCTDADQFPARGTPVTLPLVTGTASATMLNIDQKDGEALCDCPTIVPYGNPVVPSCDVRQCTGPISVAGQPLGSCDQLQTSSPDLAGLGLAGAITMLSPDRIINTVLQLAAGPPPPPSCAGDCNSDGVVTVDEVLQLVSIALGQEGIDACIAGDPDGDHQITVDEVLVAVDNALKGCSTSRVAHDPR